MKYIYTLVILGLIYILWFAPIDLERERQMADSGAKIIILFVLETTWLKVVLTVFLGFVAIGLHSNEAENKE